MTLSLPEDVYRIVKSHKEIRWSEIARQAIEDYAKKIALMNAITARSDLTEDDIMTLDEKIKAGIRQHYAKKDSAENREEDGLIRFFLRDSSGFW